MVKKKTTGQEEIRHDAPGEQVDYDADNKKRDHQEKDEEEREIQSSDVKETKESEITETAPADKVVPPEPTPEEKLAEMQDKYLRLSAEFDNYRRRTLREKMELTKYASENILINLLPFMDDLERALSHMTSSAECAPVKEGIELIYSKFAEFLKQNGVNEIEAMNCPFNVEIHDAVAQTPVNESDNKGKIVDVVQKGYYLQDKVIRHSKVVVGE
jgi:molecular chaperone GrpE